MNGKGGEREKDRNRESETMIETGSCELIHSLSLTERPIWCDQFKDSRSSSQAKPWELSRVGARIQQGIVKVLTLPLHLK
jgi:hypothetical protein